MISKAALLQKHFGTTNYTDAFRDRCQLYKPPTSIIQEQISSILPYRAPGRFEPSLPLPEDLERLKNTDGCTFVLEKSYGPAHVLRVGPYIVKVSASPKLVQVCRI